MHLTSILLPILSLLATAQAGCYKREQSIGWGVEKTAAANEIGLAASRGRLAGFFNNGQEKTECHKLAENKAVHFKVKWLGEGGLTLRDGDCYTRLRNLVKQCDKGGEDTISDWYFSADLRHGSC
ncbi:hypothetical protein MCOR25_010504 [Pyricularia grisea]|nr:hypothetical protein MCOR25_010504 [Pyricularia grisea]